MRLVVHNIRKEFKVDGEVLIIHGVQDARYIRLKQPAAPPPPFQLWLALHSFNPVAKWNSQSTNFLYCFYILNERPVKLRRIQYPLPPPPPPQMELVLSVLI